MADGDGEMVDPEMEVRKLQDLVRKLELQNDILRAKQSKNPGSHMTQFAAGDSDLEIVNVDNVSDNEETWLYESPKQLTPEQKKQSPYQWVREPFNHSDPVRKSLLFKLDEVVTNNKQSPNNSPRQPSLDSTPQRLQRFGSPQNNSNDFYDSPISHVPAIKPPLTASRFGARVNTDTYTRPKKGRSNNIMKYDWEGPISLDNYSGSPTQFDQNENKPLMENDDTQEEKKILDVHVLAKMQEESLRQSFSPLNTRRRLSRSGKNGGFYLNQGVDSSPTSNHSSPGNVDNDLIPPPRRIGRANSQNSVSSSSLNSNGSSTGASPPESIDIPHSEPVIESGLVKGRLRPNQSDPNLQQINSRTITRSAGRRSPQYRENSPSQLRAPQQVVRAVSPPSKLSGIPGPRTGIPKPGSSPRSGLPTPRRSSLPVSRGNRASDESWKDGCF